MYYLYLRLCGMCLGLSIAILGKRGRIGGRQSSLGKTLADRLGTGRVNEGTIEVLLVTPVPAKDEG